MSRLRLFAVAISLVLMPGTLFGQSTLQAQLRGHSIVMQYTEVVEGGRRHRHRTVSRVWTQGIYVSSQGRLFVHVNVSGNSRRGSRHTNITPGSDNSGGATPFQWTRNGLAREWDDHRGRPLYQTIEITKSNEGFTCRASIRRSGFESQANHQICKVVLGNPLGGM